MHPLLNIAINAARQAGEIIIRNKESIEHLKVTVKHGNESVSEVDLKAEQAIIHTILKAYPEHGIEAEESRTHNEGAETTWIIDPLDGTTNYLHGFPYYCVSIAVRVKKRIEHAVVYDPLRHEFFTASRGRGAQLNDRRIRVSKQTLLSAALLATNIHSRDRTTALRYNPTIDSLLGKCASIRRTGSVALDLAYLACGRLDGYWDFALRPWDIAAGTLLVQEAGGLLSDLQGGEDYLRQGDIIAGTPKVFSALFKTLAPVIPQRV